MQYEECIKCAKWSPRLSVLGNLLAAVFKFVVGVLAGSKGLVADSLHSAADAISSLFILISLKISGKPRDEDHPYGHGKVEYISSLVASVFLFFGATAIFLDALHTFSAGGVRGVPKNAAIVATVISLIYSYLMYSSNKCTGTQMESPALLADAAESKADSAASIAVLAGLIGTKIGFVHADTIAAVVVSLLVFHMSVEIFFTGVHGLVDVAVDKELLDEILGVSQAVEGVRGVSDIKTRRMGQKNAVDISVEVPSETSVLEAHRIAGNVKAAIQDRIGSVEAIFVRTVPEGTPWARRLVRNILDFRL
ncbi:MAG: cation diffusion facilitator family transporter [Nitrospirota bacterium]|nr:cation diffusion facilitator family transporter [Nitrospirota bacterium]